MDKHSHQANTPAPCHHINVGIDAIVGHYLENKSDSPDNESSIVAKHRIPLDVVEAVLASYFPSFSCVVSEQVEGCVEKVHSSYHCVYQIGPDVLRIYIKSHHGMYSPIFVTAEGIIRKKVAIHRKFFVFING